LSQNAAGQPSRELLKTLTPVVLLVLAAFVVAFLIADPAPPKRISIGSGATDGAYFLFAQKYRELLARQRITLDVRETAGSTENIELLVAPTAGVDIALVQGGTAASTDSKDILGVGSLFFEPIWVFYRNPTPIDRLSLLQNMTIAVGPIGSGTRAVARQLLQENGITEASARLLPLDAGQALRAFSEQRLDAAFVIASAEAPVVQELLRAPGVRLMDFSRAEAYIRNHRYLSDVTLPEGAIDLISNTPAQTVRLLAVTANLVVRRELHPALVDLLLQTATEVHSNGGLFEEPSQFPSPRYLDFPLHPDARRYYKSGPPFLQRYLPFWAATLLDRLKVMLLPLIALVLPLLKIMPPTYRWRMRSRIYRWYREIQAVEMQLEQSGEMENVNRQLAELDRIERDVTKVSVPLSFHDELYDLRMHLGLVRDRLRQVQAERSQQAGA